MLKEINNIGLFFEDCYAEYSVREYARKARISPPTASKYLKEMAKQGLLKKREERGFLLFQTNRDSIVLKKISEIYWNLVLSDLLLFLEKEVTPNSLVLFGSLSKLEAKKDSDIDLVVFSKIKKRLDLEKFEKQLKRKINVLFYESIEKVNKELKLNIINGCVLRGYLK
jgi:predicted nucleotidyltransferase